MSENTNLNKLNEMDYSEKKKGKLKKTSCFSLQLHLQKHTITGSPLCPSTLTHRENVS